MKHWIWVVWSLLLLAGCASSQSYPYPYPYSGVEGPTIRYPLDYPICYESPEGGTLYVPLRIRVTGAGVSDPMVVMARRKKDPSDDGCNRSDGSRPVRPLVWMKDSDNTGSLGAFTLDMKGNGFAAVSYKYSLLNAGDIWKESEHVLSTADVRVRNLVKFGYTNVDSVKEDDTLIINGLKWRRRLEAKYESPDPNDVSKGHLLAWHETYEHAIDSSHVLRQRAYYDAMVVADPDWIAARRAILRKLVEAIRIHQVTQADTDAAVADYDRRRAIDAKCGADKRFRAREGD